MTKRDEQDDQTTRDAIHARSASAQTPLSDRQAKEMQADQQVRSDHARGAVDQHALHDDHRLVRPAKDVQHMTPQERAKARAYYGKDDRLTEWTCQTLGGTDQAISEAMNVMIANRWHIYQFVEVEQNNAVKVFARRPLLTTEEVADLQLIEAADKRDADAEIAKRKAAEAAAAKKLAAETAAKAAEDAKLKADEESKRADEAAKKASADAKKAGAPATDEKAVAAAR